MDTLKECWEEFSKNQLLPEYALDFEQLRNMEKIFYVGANCLQYLLAKATDLEAQNEVSAAIVILEKELEDRVAELGLSDPSLN